MFLRDDGRGPLPAQFSLRVAVLGAFALVMFSIIFFRLWYLEILSGDKYLAEAQNQRVRDFTIQAPRGKITDRHGNVLVDNRTALALQIHTEELPAVAKKRNKEFRKLAGITDGLSPKEIRRNIRDQTKDAPASPVTLERDVPYDLIYYVRENQEKYPGVSVDKVYVRNYPEGDLAAHILGYVREASAEQLKEPRFQTAQPGDQVGQAGVEDTYDGVLRGTNGETRVTVDASGRPTGGTLSEREPRAGNNLTLTVDDSIQAAGEAAIGKFSTPGAFAVMNVHNGDVLAMGSSPTYDPSTFAKPTLTQAETNAIFGEPNSLVPGPIIDRADTGAYPTGSTFKPITALAALATGTITPSTIYNDTGSLQLGPGLTVHNAGDAVNGPINLETALKVSSDVFFFHLGAELDGDPNGPLQNWAENLGLGSPTGIDLPGERAGLVPSPEWRNEGFKRDTDPDSPGGSQVLLSKGETFDRPWSAGDNANLAVGQGDLQADPLQMAVVYSTIANGGDVLRPHVGLRVEDQAGRVVQQIDPQPRRHVDINPEWQHVIMSGLHAAAQEAGGTSYGIFGNYPVGVAGKTGTAERNGQLDQSWYVVMAPYPDPQIVCAVTIEQGGFGADSAAPAAREILNSYFNFKGKKADQATTSATTTATPIE
jgi:penicillin-binding protein 2